MQSLFCWGQSWYISYVCPSHNKENPHRDTSVHAWLQTSCSKMGPHLYFMRMWAWVDWGIQTTCRGCLGRYVGFSAACFFRPPLLFHPYTRIHTYTDGKEGEICKADNGMKRSGSGVWELCLLSSPYRYNTEVPCVPLRMTQENHTKVHSFAKRPHTFRTEQRVATVQRDHINRWTDYRLSLPTDVIHILGQ